MKKDFFKTFPVLETERVILRQMQETDIDVIFDFNSCLESLKYIVREPFKTKKEASEKLAFFLYGIKKKLLFGGFLHLKRPEKILAMEACLIFRM